jgi:ATP/maltotriose-dependent transcriptional regulator MalT
MLTAQREDTRTLLAFLDQLPKQPKTTHRRRGDAPDDRRSFLEVQGSRGNRHRDVTWQVLLHLELQEGDVVHRLLQACFQEAGPANQALTKPPLAIAAAAAAGDHSTYWLDPLTERETEVLRCLAEGSSNRQIADELILAEGTVKFYVHTVLDKLGVHNRTQAVIEAKRQNII